MGIIMYLIISKMSRKSVDVIKLKVHGYDL